MGEFASLPLAKAIRDAIQASGKSLAAIARDTGVSHPQLSRFVREERTLTLESAARLFDYFGMKIIAPEPETAKPAGKRKGGKK